MEDSGFKHYKVPDSMTSCTLINSAVKVVEPIKTTFELKKHDFDDIVNIDLMFNSQMFGIELEFSFDMKDAQGNHVGYEFWSRERLAVDRYVNWTERESVQEHAMRKANVELKYPLAIARRLTGFIEQFCYFGIIRSMLINENMVFCVTVATYDSSPRMLLEKCVYPSRPLAPLRTLRSVIWGN